MPAKKKEHGGPGRCSKRHEEILEKDERERASKNRRRIYKGETS